MSEVMPSEIVEGTAKGIHNPIRATHPLQPQAPRITVWRQWHLANVFKGHLGHVGTS